MNNNSDDIMEIDLLRLLRALLRKAWLIVLVTILSAVLALTGVYFLVTPLYKASVLMYVNSSDITVGGAKVSISQGELSAAKSLIDTYEVILHTRTTLNEVITEAGIDYTYEELTGMISAESVNGTEVFCIDVVSPMPGEAMKIANTIALVLPEKIASIVEGSSARIVDLAVTPSEKDSPSYRQALLLGALAGFLLSCGIVVVAELMDDKIHDTDFLLQSFDIPVLAAIPDLTADNTVHYGYYRTADNPAKK